MPLTTVDYPGTLAAILFTGGCNLRCPYCHNAAIAYDASETADEPKTSSNTPLSAPLNDAFILETLHKRANILEGLVISGGEPTLQPDLASFIRQVKEIPLKIKLDTNGLRPDVLQALLSENLLDYVALDIKHVPEKYSLLGIKNKDVAKLIDSTFNLLLNSDIIYEIRLTIPADFHTVEDIEAIGHLIQGANLLYLQPFKESPGVPNTGMKPPTDDTLLLFKTLLENYATRVVIRDR